MHAFYSTVGVRAEEGAWGSRFPVVMTQLYTGRLPGSQVASARAELRAIRDALSLWRPADVVWDNEDAAARPPWCDDISDEITSLEHYFQTDYGSPLLDVLDEALARAESERLDVRIE